MTVYLLSGPDENGVPGLPVLALIFSCGQGCCEIDYNQQDENVTAIAELPLFR
ncbi:MULTISPECIES: hypothetical protein [Brenneria]|uniref:hypothetical protein n=1 Tax=Brenneria TaxID=71655 RepID=UPI0003067B08|nr:MULTISPECIES: hypothetical protein [Brenneria]